MASLLNNPDAELIADALTRSTVRRDKAGVVGTDEELLSRLVAPLDANEIYLLAATSRVLRLMDALLTGSETGEGFVEKFSSLWTSLKPAHEQEFAQQAQRLDEFYGNIQLFCASAQDRREEPLLFGIDRLKALTEPIYADLKEWWCKRLGLR
jgi:hypothetical protein